MRKYLIVLFLIPLILSSQSFQSKHFTLQKLSEDVYAAIATNGGYAICNAGIINLGDAVLIFDPFMTPEAAEDLKKVAEQITGNKVKYVINSHYHNDHIGGNQVFKDAIIISTEKTRELIATYQPEEIKSGKTDAPKSLEKITKSDTSAMTAHEKEERIMWKAYYEALVKSSDSLKVILPDLTFSETMNIEGAKFPVQLITYGTGHTLSDLFIYLPNQKTVFLGDLLFIKNQPWLGDGDSDQWAAYLDSVSKLDINVAVPGHGPVGNKDDLQIMKLYFKKVKEIALTFYQNNLKPEEEKKISSPAPYNEWFLSVFFKPNVISEYRRLNKQGLK